jgi:hypothetical protein
MKYDLSDYDIALISLSLRHVNLESWGGAWRKEESLRLANHLTYLACNDPEAEPFD